MATETYSAGRTEVRVRPPLWKQPRKWIAGYIFTAPAITFIVIFSIISIIVSLYISFFQYDVISEHSPYVGLGNYREALFEDDLFWRALKNTFLYVLGVVPAITVFGFLLALIGYKARHGRSFFRTVYFLPSITPMVVIALIWMWLYSPKGMLNEMLASVGIRGPNWLFDRHLALPSVMVMSVWQAVGYYTVIYLAGLADIPPDFYDAARVDGASWWQEVRYVTVPLLRNVTLFVTVTLAIGAFQVFTQVYIMTRGGPGTATATLQFIIFRNAFQYFRMGYAAAISWLLFIAIFVLAMIQLRLNRSERIF
ncbi:MAG: sugar ABC transporter permease [Anaerolineae bacterium]|nr:sugar ABC transporter permease [Anaerolineae bacterium]